MFLTKHCNTRDTQWAEALRSAAEPEFPPFQFAVFMSYRLIKHSLQLYFHINGNTLIYYVSKKSRAQKPIEYLLGGIEVVKVCLVVCMLLTI